MRAQGTARGAGESGEECSRPSGTRPNTAKTHVVADDARVVPEPVGCTKVLWSDHPRPAAQDAPAIAVGLVTFAPVVGPIGIGLIPARRPLPHVAGHVGQSPRVD